MAPEHSAARGGLRVFISYRREDSSPYARDLYRELGIRLPRSQIFWDIKEIDLGRDFIEAIERAVASCDALIALIGPRWIGTEHPLEGQRLMQPDDYVRLEITTALDRNVRVFPVLVGGGSMPNERDLPEPLKKLRRLNATWLRDTDWDYDIQRLVDALSRVELLPLEPSEGRLSPSELDALSARQRPIAPQFDTAFGVAAPAASSPPLASPAHGAEGRRRPRSSKSVGLLVGGAALVLAVALAMLWLLARLNPLAPVSPTQTTPVLVVATSPTPPADASPPPTVAVAGASPAAQPRTVLLADNFPDAAGGLLAATSGDPAHYIGGYVDGEYVVKTTDPTYDRAVGSIIARSSQFPNAILAVDVRLVGETNGRVVTLECRENQEAAAQTDYEVWVRPDTQQVGLFRYVAGQGTMLDPWVTSTAVHQQNAANHIELSCLGSSISVSVNGVPVLGTEDGSLPAGIWSIYVGVLPPGLPGLVEGRITNLKLISP